MDLKGMTLDELEAFAQRLGEPRYRGRQIAHWLYQRGATSFAEMTDLPAALRTRLAADAAFTSLSTVTAPAADRGDTMEYLLRLAARAHIAAALLRDQGG